jgi:hypothetical protein
MGVVLLTTPLGSVWDLERISLPTGFTELEQHSDERGYKKNSSIMHAPLRSHLPDTQL